MLYTPRHSVTNERLCLDISEADRNTMDRHGRRRGFKGVVTDRTTGTRYAIHGAACSLPNCTRTDRDRAL